LFYGRVCCLRHTSILYLLREASRPLACSRLVCICTHPFARHGTALLHARHASGPGTGYITLCSKAVDGGDILTCAQGGASFCGNVCLVLFPLGLLCACQFAAGMRPMLQGCPMPDRAGAKPVHCLFDCDSLALSWEEYDTVERRCCQAGNDPFSCLLGMTSDQLVVCLSAGANIHAV
jgi:hypothetical protein